MAVDSGIDVLVSSPNSAGPGNVYTLTLRVADAVIYCFCPFSASRATEVPKGFTSTRAVVLDAELHQIVL